jgi:hypothetical protein
MSLHTTNISLLSHGETPERLEASALPMGRAEQRTSEEPMKRNRQFGVWTVLVLGVLLGLIACTYDAALQQLSPAEKAEFALYHHRMTGRQAHSYLAKASAAERTAYLRAIGLAQRFEALDPLDRAAVQAGWPRVGMSAEALRFVWGDPYHTTGDPRRSAHWYYLGSSFGRSAYNNPRWGFGNRVAVYLVDGRVVGWVDVAPSTQEAAGGCDRC